MTEKCQVRDGERIDKVLKIMTQCVEQHERKQKNLNDNVRQTHQTEYLKQQNFLKNSEDNNRSNYDF